MSATQAASTEDVLLEHLEDGVLTLTMNRPERKNTLSPELLDALQRACQRAASDPAVRAVLLTGAGGAFCAGGDVKAMAAGGNKATPDQRMRALRQRMEASRLLYQMSKPTVAMIPGACAGAGLSLALACDFRIATSDAKITTAFAKVALSGDFGGTWFLPRVVGPAKARELYLLSPVLSGAEAQAIGLVTRAVPADRLEAETRELLKTLAHGPTVTYGYIKDNLNQSGQTDLVTMLDAEAMRHTRCGGTEDHAEAAAAFVAKRAPVFKGA